jgi:putative ATP-dependent endonuclease of OLD family
MLVHWWSRDKLEPLTAGQVIAVEGASDRIILEKVAELTDHGLDRLGVAVIETDGAGEMGPIITLFGGSGFQVPMSLLIDADAKAETARKLGVAEGDLNASSAWVSDPDLEGEYVAALGAGVAWKALETCGLFSRNELANCTATGPGGTRTDADVAAFCRRSKAGYKVRAAMAVADVLTPETARLIGSIRSLLDEFAPET